jgi:phosphinothricin acetyltransferase
MKICIANKSHFKSIIEIYNWAVENTTATFDTQIKTLDTYQEFLTSFNRLPLTVITDDSIVLGWACLKPYSSRAAYDDTVELSVYIDPNSHGKGLGSEMMKDLIIRAKDLGLHTILSRVTTESAPSIKLHEKFDFINIGVMREVGLKFNRRCDVAWMQLILE